MPKKKPLRKGLSLNGARRSIIEEPLEYIQLIRIPWQSPKVNHRGLPLLRFTQGKTERELAKHFNRSKTAIHELLARMIKNDFKQAKLTKDERERIKWATQI